MASCQLYRNFSRKLFDKFSFWDYLFKTAYNPDYPPGDLPENWGLGYEYPRDYFLQHAFSVKRFNENNLLKYKWFKRYYYIRAGILKSAGNMFSSRTQKSNPTRVHPVVINEQEDKYANN